MKTLATGDRVEHVATGKQGEVINSGEINVLVKYDDGEVATLFWARNVFGERNARHLQRLARVTGGARFRAKR